MTLICSTIQNICCTQNWYSSHLMVGRASCIRNTSHFSKKKGEFLWWSNGWKFMIGTFKLVKTDNAPVFWTPPHAPTPGMAGAFTQCEWESQWRSPPLGTWPYKPNSCVCWIGCDSLSKSPHQTLMSTCGRKLIYVKCSNCQGARKWDRWQIKCESPAHPLTSWAKVLI